MNSYGAINGEPVAGSKILTNLLRDEMGLMASLYQIIPIAELWRRQKVCKTLLRLKTSLESGIDVELPSGNVITMNFLN